ncbi:MAG TPA: hypothetical protein VGH36_03960 [Acetobacteraceae bacterium]
MTAHKTDGSGAGGLGDMLALAAQTVGSGSDLAIAAGQVIARRVALGVAAAVNPMQADHAEFARMVPEKMEAFSAAGMAVIEHSEGVTSQISRFASDEVMTAAWATIEMAACADPFSMLAAQGRFIQAWFDRTAANFMTLGMMTLGVPAAALAPLQVAVAANTERLG